MARKRFSTEQFVEMDLVLARHLPAYIRRLGDVEDTAPLFGFTRLIKKKGERRAKPVQYSWVPSMTTFYKALAAAGIPRKDKTDRIVDFHALQKTYVTHLRMQGVPVEDAQRLARHSDIKLTQEIHTDYDLLPGREEAAAEALVGMWEARASDDGKT